ncbi:hypothetical protein DAEQUDRAFT_345429 [Daedalea quercina L-15889]|uniref:Uncharacterized protein n=1 Tax=Daedalea quercina L-15889 TaxID=1314783 RepID=A0A165PHH3_9APHY|nr:hypothetical protein DAEQUDRAFT_345429 [Daedalea quercina L-15889]
MGPISAMIDEHLFRLALAIETTMFSVLALGFLVPKFYTSGHRMLACSVPGCGHYIRPPTAWTFFTVCMALTLLHRHSPTRSKCVSYYADYGHV